MFGLQRIALHHSYLPNKSTAIECAGNTNLSGDNGAGKTSALNLIPIFYGEQPDRLVNRAGGKQDFLDYYLPSTASVIAFDYLREDGPRCVVIYRIKRSDGPRLAYRFVDSSFESAFLSETLKPKMMQGIAITDALNEIAQSGVKISNQLLTVMDYRAVIQQDERLLKRGGALKKTLRDDAKHFCLGASTCKMSHMDRLTFAILKRSSMFGRLKSMIADTFFEDLAISDKPEHLKNPELIQDIRHIRTFLEQKPQFKKTIDQAHERLNIANKMVASKQALDLKLIDAQDQLGKLDQAYQSMLTEKQKLEEHRTEEEHRLSLKIKDHKSDVNRINRDLDTLHQRKSEWDAQNIIFKLSEWNNLNDIQQQHEEALEHWKSLKEDIDAIELERLQAEKRAQESLERHKVRIENQREQLRSDITEAQSTFSETKESLLLDRQKRLDEWREDMQLALEEIQNAIADCRSSSHSPSLTESEQIEVEALSERIDSSEHQIEMAESHYERLLQEQAQAKTAHNEKLEALESSNQRLQTAQKTIDSLKKQLFPDQGTFLNALRESNEQWVHTIGKVIPESLLHRKDLNPTYDPEQNHTLYGWEIDLQSLPTPAQAQSEAALRTDLETAEQAFLTFEEQHQKLQKIAEQSQTQLKAFENQIKTHKYALDQLKSDLRALKSNKKTLHQKIQEQAAERKAQAKQQLESLKQRKDEIKDSYQTTRESLEFDFNQQLQSLTANHDISLGDLKEQLDCLDDQLLNHQKDYKKKLSDIKTQFSEQCQQEGVDPALIHDAQTQTEQLKQRIIDIQESQPSIHEYKAWVASEWENRDVLEAQLREHKDQSATAEQQLASFKANYLQQKQALSHSLKQTEKNLTGLKSQIQEASTLSANIQLPSTSEQPVSIDNNLSLNELTLRLQELNDHHYRLKSRILEGVEQAIKIIHQYPKTQIQSAWRLLMETRSAQTASSELSETFRLNQVQDLEVLIDQLLPQMQASLVESIRSVGGSVAHYYETLRRLNKQVAEVSHTLKTRLNTNQSIDSLSDIQITLKSRLEEESCWLPLKDFHDEWQTWQASKPSQLPPEFLISALKQALDALTDARIAKQVDSLIEMHLSMVENGRSVTVRSDADFNHMSSNGLSYLAICVVFMAMCRYLCPDKKVQLTWPVDELTSLSPSNIQKLFAMMASENIWMFSAFPSSDPNLLRFFEHRNFIDKKKGIRLIAAENTAFKSALKDRLSSAKKVSTSLPKKASEAMVEFTLSALSEEDLS